MNLANLDPDIIGFGGIEMVKVIFPAGTPQSIKDRFARFFEDVFRDMTPEQIRQFEREWDEAELRNPLLINHPEIYRNPEVLEKFLNPVIHMINIRKKQYRKLTLKKPKNSPKKVGTRKRTELAPYLKKIANKKIVLDGVEWYVLDTETNKSNAIETRDGWKEFARENDYNYNTLTIDSMKDGNGFEIWMVLVR
jgi:hypothetical protein